MSDTVFVVAHGTLKASSSSCCGCKTSKKGEGGAKWWGQGGAELPHTSWTSTFAGCIKEGIQTIRALLCCQTSARFLTPLP